MAAESTVQAADESIDQSEDDDLRQMVEQLADRVDELEEENKELKKELNETRSSSVTKDTVNLIIGKLTSADIDDYTADPARNLTQVSDFNTRVNSLESVVKRHEGVVSDLGVGKSSSVSESWYAIVETAKNLKADPDHKLPNNRVRLFRENIAQATGKSKRQASNYIEQFGDNKKGAEWTKYEPASARNNNNAKKKSIVVDLDVWGDLDDE